MTSLTASRYQPRLRTSVPGGDAGHHANSPSFILEAQQQGALCTVTLPHIMENIGEAACLVITELQYQMRPADKSGAVTREKALHQDPTSYWPIIHSDRTRTPHPLIDFSQLSVCYSEMNLSLQSWRFVTVYQSGG